jgi:MerR family transcriptional regulator, repressor of the yfmOP operon
VSEGERPLRIGELARATGTTPRTIRYYEEVGLLPAGDAREPGEHRLYPPDDVERLREILRLKELLGLSLDELRELAAAQTARAALRSEWHEGVEDPVRRREILDESAGHIDRQLALVRRRKREIESLEDRLAIRRAEVADRRARLAAERTEA